MSYHCFCTIPWKTPQKKRKRSPLDGRGRDTGVYYKGYAKSYPKELTAKQHRIMTGELPLEEVRLNEIREIMKKAAFNEDQDLLEAATDLYNAKSNPNSHQPAYSLEEAKDILQSLTPWTIEWDKDGNSTFEPQIVKNLQKDISGIDEKIISMSLSTLLVTKKWYQPIHGWGSVYNEFCIMYAGRMPE